MTTTPLSLASLTPIKYVLPSYWASYLINGDASGIDESDVKACDEFHAKYSLPAPCSCSDEQWFANSNDAGTLAGDVLEYTYLVEAKTQFGNCGD